MLNFLIAENIRNDGNSILKQVYRYQNVEYYVSGSSRQYINGSKQMTKPEYAFDQMDKKYDWCSNCGKSVSDHPWLILGVKSRMMKLDGYYLRAGCCYSGCCCEDTGYCCECCLFSWSFQISNDNVTWNTIHKVEKDYEMRNCKEKTYTFSQSYTAKYARIIQDETCYDEPPCIALNKIELIGSIEGNDIVDDRLNIDVDDDDVSIIGHISKANLR
ncbi:hypothetical protein TVAG_019170 [Trichomonas vaginalis G3]|uniref:F5/8 type C domain-containing protein n=1 Tax=Trichomonas vaginalis (strain ATCC PRA-98 / G3) TaxID=412133 RepID=A2DWZ0_TRIV3|nr:hypothetical protein TVAGG3_0184760 [Trichomonas vaginalis G3]EAY15017.1 hypothetical protein TVAG_019170 [Trichomonas vaginalis G3]KAI5549557.1 hypothetical protein TVAGG3_0184760 [Trichomonas vaginalis G3]|eukprot:XP_001327240.1 hypothetical protein [Trichomonas vaginalis G3]